MNKEQQELSEPTMETVSRFKFVDGCAGCCECGLEDVADGDYVDATDYDALLALHNASLTRERELRDKIELDDSFHQHCLKSAVDSKVLLRHAESQLLAKDALIASLKSERSKQDKAEDELLATGEKLAEEKGEPNG